jgi:hypothetical protein
MKIGIHWVVAVSVLWTQIASASLPGTKHIAKLDHIGRIKLGDSIDSLPAISHEKRQAHFGKHTHFSFYIFTHELPQKCMNLQCGRFASKVLSRGGVLLGGAAGEYAKDLGVDSANSFLLVTDAKDRVTAIYQDVSAENFDEALEPIQSTE